MKKIYRKRVIDCLSLLDSLVNQSLDIDVELVRAAEKISRRMRNKSIIKRCYKKKGKYGKLTRNNKHEYMKDVNFLYHVSHKNINEISNLLGISTTSVNMLISASPLDKQPDK